MGCKDKPCNEGIEKAGAESQLKGNLLAQNTNRNCKLSSCDLVAAYAQLFQAALERNMMRILPPEPNINMYTEGFGDVDVLERRKTGKALSDLVDRIEDPLVIALNGQWGAGKTHFLKRWVGAHSVENGSDATTIYFDAFAHDYLNDPLPALVSALADRLPSSSKKKVDKVKAAAFKLAKPIARIGLALATSGASEVLNNVGDAVAEAASKEAAASLKKYWKEESGRRHAMDEFKSALEALADSDEEGATGSSLVFVIDELDRCRPDYSLEVLEVIKHFFSVPRVHFILGVNLDALENSVKARYGENIDGHAYLRKFIQVTLELPIEIGTVHNAMRTNLVYLGYLVKVMGVPNHIAEPLREQVRIVSNCNRISIREIGKIVSSISLASDGVLGGHDILSGWILVMIDLIIAKTVRPDLYLSFLHASVSDADLVSYLGATEEKISEMLGDESNPNYDHQVFWRYLTWKFLVNDGQLAHEYSKHISRSFSDFRGLREARKLPMKIHQMWLDQFSFYTPS